MAGSDARGATVVTTTIRTMVGGGGGGGGASVVLTTVVGSAAAAGPVGAAACLATASRADTDSSHCRYEVTTKVAEAATPTESTRPPSAG